MTTQMQVRNDQRLQTRTKIYRLHPQKMVLHHNSLYFNEQALWYAANDRNP